MSSIIVGFKKDYRKLVEDSYFELNKKISEFTANLFHKDVDEIVVDFEEFEFYSGSRDFLIKAETSKKNIELLNDWAEGLKNIFLDLGWAIPGVRIGVKTYVLDSCWREVELK